MKPVLNKIILMDFKGVKGMKEIKLGNTVQILGRNAAGKSTVMDAHLWLWIDKDSSLKSNPEIYPDDGRECIPTIEEEWEINGIKLIVSKMQKKKIGKPNENGISKVSFTNTYSINGVPKTERDFKKDLIERGFDFDNFLLISHIEGSVYRKNSDMRNKLFDMASKKTDLEIALLIDGCKDVAKLLENYRVAEITAMSKASKKKAEEQLSAIPNQIIGLEKAKIDMDIASLVIRRDAIKNEILELDNMTLNSEKSEIDVLKMDEQEKKLREFKKRKSEIEEAAKTVLNEMRTEINSKIYCLTEKENQLKSDFKFVELNLNTIKKEINLYDKELKKAREDYIVCSELGYDETHLQKIESEEFNEESLICPTCGQLYSDDMKLKMREAFEQSKKKRIEQELFLKKLFEEDKDKKLDEITKNGTITNEKIRNAKAEKIVIEQKIVDIKQEIIAISEEIKRLNQELEKIPKNIDLSNNNEYQVVCKEIEKLKEEWKERSNVSDFRKKKKTERNEKQKEFETILSEISKAENNIRIDKQISELEQKKLGHGQAKADSEKILYQLSLLEKTKNEILSEEINKNFEIVRWKLFDYLKNGEYKECCIPEVYDDAKKEWRQIGTSANTALEIRGKLDIIRGFQNFYGFYPPVFVDNAESLDTENTKKIQMDCQMIFLKVSDSDFKVKEI